ncbi:MAG: alpha-glucosidase/alpha-galactosidase [Oliverpabstia sp.]
MKYNGQKAEDVKIAYIGGGSRGWAWGLMSDLVSCDDMTGSVYLYDIDFKAAKNNEIIGNKFNSAEGAKSIWNYKAVEGIGEALTGADIVIISILPGTFNEMESDVHTPEKYGIYQSVGDTAGPGGIIRAMRTVPMFEEIGQNIKKYCPNAWVINYTNPMTLCVKTLYRVFPEIKAFGCCHEVFGTQEFLRIMVEEMLGEKNVTRDDIKVNPVSVNHFTWLTSATYKNIDLFPYYKEFCHKHKDGYDNGQVDANWMNNSFKSQEKVKMDLFNRFGYIAAAGDRHLAEFCEGKWYLENPERVKEMHFGLTTVAWRKEDLKSRLAKSARLVNGEENVKIDRTGEEGVTQIRALLGLCELITNVNIPNRGQIPNLPIGAVVETNAVFRSNTLTPVFAGEIPKEIYPMVARVCAEQELLSEGIAERNIEKIFSAFANDPLVTCGIEDARKLFDEMCENTKQYLSMYDI